MPNAWFDYIFPLMICTGVIVIGLAAFRGFPRGDRDAKGNKYGPAAGCLGILFTFVAGALGLTYLLTSPTPWERQRILSHIFRTPPEQIARFVIKPASANQYRPLTKSEVVIDEPPRIRKIAEILRAAHDVSQHTTKWESGRWSACIEMVTRDGSYYFRVNASVSMPPNATLVHVGSNPDGDGWNLGCLRADGLDRILEDAVKSPEAR
jgi:hypothetical protein